MKTILLPVLFLMFTGSLVAQYIPFPITNAKWSIKVTPYNVGNPYLSQEFGYLHETNSDTLINGLVYQKLFQRRTWWKEDYFHEDDNGNITEYHESGNYEESPVLIGALRQDTVARKIYYRELSSSIDNVFCIQPINLSNYPTGEDILLLDFDMGVGDTILLGWEENSFIIQSIDSVQYNDGIYRKRYFPAQSVTEFYFIEGIGTDAGLFAGIRGDFVEGEYCYINCFSKGDEYVIGNSVYNCDSIDALSPVIEIDPKTKISFYPNPFDQYLQIDFHSSQSQDIRILVHDCLGQLIVEKVISSAQQYRIATQNLSSGLYLISVYKGNRLISTEKITKTN